jgi:BirA family transcriptional regulator, biotin operon repressor / biotin---[acetyl-CoA-carboxylase] ligase
VSPVAAVAANGYDGVRPGALAAMLRVPTVHVYESVPSTLDVAHELGARGAESGTLVLADSQTAGRGRGGKRWASAPGAGIWMTLVERDVDAAVIELLSLRLGLAAASTLDAFVDDTVRVKWPNDLYLGNSKLAGILVEARWRSRAAEWAAVGLGLNVRVPPDVPNACALRAGSKRVDVLRVLVPALRGVLASRGALDATELRELERRDMSRGRRVDQPGVGTVEGVSDVGELLVRTAGGSLDRYRAGSLVFSEGS